MHHGRDQCLPDHHRRQPGGFLDKVISANIDESIGFMIKGGWLKEVTDQAERDQIIEQTRAAMHESAGLNSPFLLRCFKWLWKGITLDWV